MRELSFLLIIIFFSFNTNADYLSYTETSTIKMSYGKGVNPAVAKAMAKMASAQNTKTVSKYYAYNGILARINREDSVLWDFKDGKMTSINHEDKTYYIQPLNKLIKDAANTLEKVNTSIDIGYTPLNKKNKVAGKTCHMYKTSNKTNYKKMGNTSMKMSSIKCMWLNPPKAWRVYMEFANGLDASSLRKKVDGNFMDTAASLGIPLYAKTKSKMVMGGAHMANVPIPETTTTDVLSEISLKSFPKSNLRVPKGYKKLAPPKMPAEYLKMMGK